jgi:hypothetical protein
MTARVRYLLVALLVVLLVYLIESRLVDHSSDAPSNSPPVDEIPAIQSEPSAGLAQTPVSPQLPAVSSSPDQVAPSPVREVNPAVLTSSLAEPADQPEPAGKVVIEEKTTAATAEATPKATSKATSEEPPEPEMNAAAKQETGKYPSASPPSGAIVAKTKPQAVRGARMLPEQIGLRYSVQSGEDGLIVGQAHYSGQVRDGRYALVSVTEATGISALFLRGKIVQRSEGRVTPDGLRPEVFTSAKSEKKVKTAHFDWTRGQLLLSAGSLELPPDAQDLTSFPFHLAMRVEADDPEWTLSVTNGKNLRDYRFHVIGGETLTLAGKRVETLHLQGNRIGEGRFDVWLAPAREWLPVRIRTLDENGKQITMTLL